MKKTYLISLFFILMLSPALQAGAQCCGNNGPASTPQIPWLYSSWYGAACAMIIISPLQHFWNNEVSEYLKTLKARYYATQKRSHCCAHESDK